MSNIITLTSIDEEKDKLTTILSEEYSKNIITIKEYEHILEYINKIETEREIVIVKKIIQEYSEKKDNLELLSYDSRKNIFSHKSSYMKSVNGNGGKYTNIFGSDRIIVENLPKGKTVLHVECIFGLTEIMVPKHIKITSQISPIFSGIFVPPNEINKSENTPELYLVGRAVFGNITIQRV